MSSIFPFRLYLVLSEDSCAGRDFTWLTEQAIRGGVDIVQLREKKASTPVFLEKALRLREILDRYKVPLIINDNLEVAIQARAFGIHVGRADSSPACIRNEWKECASLGYSIEYPEQLDTEDCRVSDYLGISPVFRTATKPDTVTEWGLEGIRTIRRNTAKPLVAIGNIHAGNAFDVIKAGADCLALVSAIGSAPHPAQAAEQIRNQIEKAL